MIKEGNEMKKKFSLILLSVALVVCSVFAFVIPQGVNTAKAETTNYFKIVDGASVRTESNEKGEAGIRFIVQVSADVKEELIGKDFGFVISREDAFDGQTKFANMENASKTFVKITEDNVDDKFYPFTPKGSTEEFYRTNVVINKGTSDDANKFLKRVYSAVAFYTADAEVLDDGTNYVYSVNRQERSIQQVASALYLDEHETWENVKATYAQIGTENVPILVSQDGDCSYAKFKAMVEADKADGLKFALTENVITENKASDESALIKGEFDVYTSAEFYTVEHKVTEVYSANKAVDLTSKVSTVDSSIVTYSVVAPDKTSVTVEDNKFTPTVKGKYTVTATAGVGSTSFTVEVAENDYVDGLILDGTSVTDEAMTTDIMLAYQEMQTEELIQKQEAFKAGTTISTSFDSSVKYDAASNGSYKLDIKMKEGTTEVTASGWVQMNIRPAFSKEYYQGLLAEGYTQLAIRYMTTSNNLTNGIYYIDSSQTKTDMAIYKDNVAMATKNSYIFWANGASSDFQKIGNYVWAEMVYDLNRFISSFGGFMTLNVFTTASTAVDFTMYIDNIYAVKGGVSETLTAPTTSYVDKGTEFDTEALVAENGITSATHDGEALALTDGKATLSDYGFYSFKKVARNAYGYVGANVITNGSVVSYVPSNFAGRHAHSNTANGSYTYDSALDNSGNVIISAGGAGKVKSSSTTTFAIKPLGDKAYYQALQTAGYAYITYEYTLDITGTCAANIYRTGLTTTDLGHSNNWNYGTNTFRFLAAKNGVQEFDSETKASGNKAFQSCNAADIGNWNGVKYTISIPIEVFINNFAQEVRILSFWFSGASLETDYSVTFGRICATTEACVIA